VWQSENNMKMFDGQQVICHLIHPQFLLDILTLWAVTVATTIPTVNFTLASGTAYFVSAQRFRFTIANMLQHRAHTVVRIVFC
jgi:hypothetical protein